MEYSGPGRLVLMKRRAARPCHLLRNSLFSSFTVGCQNATGDFRPALPDKPQREPRSLSSADTGAIVTRRFLFFLLALLILTCTAYAAPLQPGFKTLGIWDPAKNVRLDFAVWYPAVPRPFRSITETGTSPPHAAGLPWKENTLSSCSPMTARDHAFPCMNWHRNSPATALSSWPSRIPAIMWTTWEPFSCPCR